MKKNVKDYMQYLEAFVDNYKKTGMVPLTEQEYWKMREKIDEQQV